MTDWFPGPAWLFCPADRPDRYGKALSRADLVIVDLEDAVAPANRSAARDALRQLARDRVLDPGRTVVRINGTQSGDHQLDLALLAEIGLLRVMLAKSEDPVQLAAIEHEVVLLVETPRGVERLTELAAQDNVIGVMWGPTTWSPGWVARPVDNRTAAIAMWPASPAPRRC